MKVDLEPAKLEDVQAIFALTKELILRYEDLEQIDCQKVFAWCRRKIEKQLDDYRRICLDGQVAGYVAVHDEGTKREIDDLYLYPAFQRRGIGTQVLQQMIAQALKDQKLPYLYVFIRNEGAVRLYRRLGFVVASQIQTSRYIMEYRS